MRLLNKVVLVALMLVSITSFANPIAYVKFATGEVSVERDGQLLNLNAGDSVYVGDTLSTQVNSQLFLDTIDQGIISLRSDTQVVIEIYHYDSLDPKQSKIKLNLLKGVLRSVSGKGAQAAKQNYRLNTPVAALGVRGTDYSVVATPNKTRAAIHSGGIFMSAYSESCQVDSYRACNDSNSIALIASDASKGTLLEMQKEMTKPTLIKEQEPLFQKNDSFSKTDTTLNVPTIDPNSSLAIDTQLTTIPGQLYTSEAGSKLYWGKWQTFANLTPDQVTARLNQMQLLGYNNMFIIARDDGLFSMPSKGQVTFSLSGAEAYFVYPVATNKPIQANVLDPHLSVNFNNNTFATSLTVEKFGLKVPFYATGQISKDGQILLGTSRGNGQIVGGLGGINASQAAYVFQTNANDNLYKVQAIGATAWQQSPSP